MVTNEILFVIAKNDQCLLNIRKHILFTGTFVDIINKMYIFLATLFIFALELRPTLLEHTRS